MKGDFRLKILNLIVEATVTVFDVANAVADVPYKSSYSRRSYAAPVSAEERSRQRVYDLLHHLRKDGLVEEKSSGRRRVLALTALGKSALAALKLRKADKLPEPNSFRLEKDSKFTIVVFDVPEKERRKRDWLRDVLRNLGLKMIQKSVWIGKVKIPRALFDDIERLRIGEYIEIFEITKTGSLHHVL